MDKYRFFHKTIADPPTLLNRCAVYTGTVSPASMRNEEPASPIIPTSSSSSSSLLAPAGLPVVAVKKPKEEDEPPAVVSSSSSSLPAATSVPVFKNDWEPGNWCWLLDDDNNCNSAPVLAVQEEAAVKKEKEEETEIKAEHEDVNFSSAPQIVSSFSSSQSSAGSIRSKKEDENEEKDNTLYRDDEEETVKKIKSEHDDGDDFSSAPQVVPSFSSSHSSAGSSCSKKEEENEEKDNTFHRDEEETAIKIKSEHDDDAVSTAPKMGFCDLSLPTPVSSRSKKKVEHEQKHTRLRPDIDDDNHDNNNNRKNDDGGSSNNTIMNTSMGTNDPAPFDDNWRKGSWCWERPTTNCGSRSDGVASVAAGSTCRKRSTKRKAAPQHDPYDDAWTTSCWCWAPPNTNSGISGVALAATAASATGRRKKQKGLDQSQESRYIDPSNDPNIGHRSTNSSIDINKDDDADDILETDSDYVSVDDDDESVSDNANRGNGIREKRWNKMYDRLVKYTKRYKSITFTRNFDDKHNLRQWICTQRLKYKRNVLSLDQINRLESIGFIWENVYDKKWIEMYARLAAYKKQYKSMCVPERYPADPPLASWVRNQRTNYKTKNPALTIDRISKLNSIGFVWNTLFEQWVKMFDRLVEYKKEYKTTCVPSIFPKDKQLGVWVHNQRSFYNTNKSQLTADRIAELDSIGFVWNPLDANWTEMYDRLVDYNKEKKSTCVPLVYPADPQLGRWVSTQRTNYKTKNPALTIDRISKLNSIGFVWNPKNAQWTDKYLRLIEYKKQHESTCVPHPYEDDPSLGKWVSAQRAYYKSNKSYLAVDRIGKLDSIGFVWNPLDYDAQWKEKYERLVNYKKQNKTTCVPALYPADPQLGRWVRKQRSNYDANESCLTMDRIAQLDSIGFVWKIRTK